MTKIEILFSDAYKHFMEKKYKEALAKLSEAESYLQIEYSDELKIIIENLKGFSYLGLEENNVARKCFETALNINPESSQACAGLAEIFYMTGQDKEAKTMFEYAVINNRKNQFAINGLAKVNELLNLPAAHNSLVSENEAELSDIRNIVLEASEVFGKGQYEKAIEGINSIEVKVENNLTDLAELFTEMLNLKATSFLNLNKPEEAQADFEKALNISPDSSTACWGLAEIFYRKEMYEEAKTMYEWALKNDDNNIAAKEGISKINRLLGMSDNEALNCKPTLRLASGKIVEIE